MGAPSGLCHLSHDTIIGYTWLQLDNIVLLLLLMKLVTDFSKKIPEAILTNLNL